MALNFPIINFVNSSFNLEFNTLEFKSTFTNTSQRVALNTGIWVAQYSLPIMDRENIAQWRAFFASLQGKKNTFFAYDPDYTTPRGVATGTPLVNGASQTGTSLITDGWTPSTTGILKAGDYFSVGGELKIVTQDTDSDGAGACTINFQPAIRNSPSDNASITTNNPKCEMYINSDTVQIQTNFLKHSLPLSFSGVEAI